MRAQERDTIFALSTGLPPAAIAVIRISGVAAFAALPSLGVDTPPPPRMAALRTLRDTSDGSELDRAIVLVLPGPDSATGEDVVELHVHGGRAVVDAVLSALGRVPRLRPAEAGEFTRRAFLTGRMDLAEVAGLAELLGAETEMQRRQAMRRAGGHLSRLVTGWRRVVLDLAAIVEAELDFSDEDDVAAKTDGGDFVQPAMALRDKIERVLASPSVERLFDGVRVVLAGPPNSGKSTLLNALAARDVAIVAPIAGTTRDVIETPVSIDGIAFLLSDTAGLRDSSDPVEKIGIARARAALEAADLILWLGDAESAPAGETLIVSAFADRGIRRPGALSISPITGEGMATLRAALIARARTMLPGESETAFDRRQRGALVEVRDAIGAAIAADDPLIRAEHLRMARSAFDRILGQTGLEEMLDALFARFCVGK